MKIQPPQRMTGVARSSSNHCRHRGKINSAICSGQNSAPMALINTGMANAALTQKRLLISMSSALSSSTSTDMGSRAIPHFGQLPGSSRIISGCIGQVYWVADTCCCGDTGSNDIPHFGQLPGLS